MRAVALWVVSHASLAQGAGVDAAVLAQMDDLYGRREESQALDQLITMGRAALQTAPDSYDVTWRLARAFSWRGSAGTSPPAQRDAAGTAMQYAETAVALNPQGAEGHLARWFGETVLASVAP